MRTRSAGIRVFGRAPGNERIAGRACYLYEKNRMSREKKALVFDIERFATKDGPGIRTVVFFKACHLHCQWCQNPESQLSRPEIMYDGKKCAACGRCLEGCPEKAVRKDERYGLLTDPALCVACGQCVSNCYYNARKLVGKTYTVDELMREILKDISFYENSGGGVTFSGGEPMLQAGFLRAVCLACREHRIHRAIETCGHASWNLFADIVDELDLVFFDLKHIDSEVHREHTGVPNELILENLKKIGRAAARLIVRIPVIPGFNDDPQIQRRMLWFIRNEVAGVEAVELLPFHRLGSAKYSGLGRIYAMDGIPSLKRNDLKNMLRFGLDLGLPVRIDTV